MEIEELMWVWVFLNYLGPLPSMAAHEYGTSPTAILVQTYRPTQPCFSLAGTNVCTLPVTEMALVQIWQPGLQLFGNTSHVA